MRFLCEWFNRRNIWVRRLLLLGLGLAAALGMLWFTPTPYFITAPGAAIDTTRLVSVSGGVPHRGRLYMLVVTTQPANLLLYLYARLDPRAVLETRREFLGDVEDYDEYLELTRQMMADSRQLAPAVALQQAGYGQGVRSVGIRVVGLQTGSPAGGYLQSGDVILEAGGRPMQTTVELLEVLNTYAPGASILVRLRRGTEELPVEVPTYEHPDPQRKGTAAFGILTKDELTFDIPIPVNIRAGPITGPSAGLMFALQIVDQLSQHGIAPGLTVAGTGTVEADGTVGSIGGVQQKVYTAEAAGAHIMFVPQGNFAAARTVATRVQVVPIRHVREALDWLSVNVGKAGLSHSAPGYRTVDNCLQASI